MTVARYAPRMLLRRALLASGLLAAGILAPAASRAFAGAVPVGADAADLAAY